MRTSMCLVLCIGVTALGCGEANINLPGDGGTSTTDNGVHQDGSVSTLSCSPGTHECRSACVDNLSVATCGQRCAPCAAPANGTASCDGETCLFACNPGFHACGDRCVSSSSVDSCGDLCSPCPTALNADVRCAREAGATEYTCQGTCRQGFDVCSGDCVNLLTNQRNCGQCGRACAGNQFCLGGNCEAAPSCDANRPCPGLSYCDAGTCRLGCAIPATTPPQCGENQTCNPTTRSCDCDPGFIICNGVCVSATSVTSCGQCNRTCVAPEFATPSCDGNNCLATCIPGFHLCGNQCVSNSSAATCGTSCSPCATPSNGVAVCNEGQCRASCSDGFTSCGTQCINTRSDRNNCGACGRVCGTTCSDGVCAGEGPGDSGVTPTGPCLSDSLVQVFEGEGVQFTFNAQTVDHSIGSCQQTSPGTTPDVTFVWTAPATGPWLFQTSDRGIQLYARAACAGPDLACANPNDGTRMTLMATAGRQYFVSVDHVGGSSPPSQVIVSMRPIQAPN